MWPTWKILSGKCWVASARHEKTPWAPRTTWQITLGSLHLIIHFIAHLVEEAEEMEKRILVSQCFVTFSLTWIPRFKYTEGGLIPLCYLDGGNQQMQMTDTVMGCLSITLEPNKSLSAPVSSLPDGSLVCFLGIAAGTVCREELIHSPAAKTKYQRRDVLWINRPAAMTDQFYATRFISMWQRFAARS